MSKAEKIKNFDPNAIGLVDNTIFGLPFNVEEADIVIVPVPWDVTVSYRAGTSAGPQAVFDESFQVDLYVPGQPDARQRGIAITDHPEHIAHLSHQLRAQAESLIELQSQGTVASELERQIATINTGSEAMIQYVKATCAPLFDQKKTIGLLGGDHSTPLGLIQTCADHYDQFGILQIDAHCDLRDAYEGFTYSHASIMTNALKINAVQKLVQVGIRDYCQEEVEVINNSQGRITTFFDKDLKDTSYQGVTRHQQVQSIVSELPDHIYLSFDIDGLDPKLCPHTGTPVAGGFEANQIIYLLEQIVKSGKTIIAFDINEVGNNPRDASIAARLLYQISHLVRESQHKK